MEGVVRQNGAIPATIGILEGQLTVGKLWKQIKCNMKLIGKSVAKGSLSTTCIHVISSTAITFFYKNLY